MAFRIVICIKQVSNPDYFSEITINPVTGNIEREKVPAILNPLDENALEAGLRIKEKYGGNVTVVSMGPPQAKEVLEWGLSLGADDAVLLSDKAFAGADSLATAFALAKYIEKSGMPDIILCGNQTVDGATGQVGPQIAELLNIPHVTCVSEVNVINDKTLIAKQDIEYGGYLKVEIKIPALIAVTKDINKVRDVTAEGIMSLWEKGFKTLKAADIGANDELIGLKGSPTRVVGTFKQKLERQQKILNGASKEIASSVIKELQQVEVL